MKVAVVIFVFALLRPVSAEMRIWRTADGSTYPGTFEKIQMSKIQLRDPLGKGFLISINDLSEPDIKYLTGIASPDVSITVRKKDRQQPLMEWSIPGDITTLHTFTVRITKTSRLPSTVPLTAELFVLGDQVDGDNYVLVRLETTHFVFPEDNKTPYEYEVVDVPFREYYEAWAAEAAKERGVTYAGYLIVVSDSKGNLLVTENKARGMRWLDEDLSESIKKLREIAVQGRGSEFSRHFNSSLRKVSPPRIRWHPRDAIF